MTTKVSLQNLASGRPAARAAGKPRPCILGYDRIIMNLISIPKRSPTHVGLPGWKPKSKLFLTGPAVLPTPVTFHILIRRLFGVETEMLRTGKYTPPDITGIGKSTEIFELELL